MYLSRGTDALGGEEGEGECPIFIMIGVKVGSGAEEERREELALLRARIPRDAPIRNINAPSDAVASAVNQEKATREPSDIYLGIELGGE